MYKVLVVDDEEKIRKVLNEYLTYDGYKVSEASNGIEAVEMVGKEDFDLIIMDIMMPKLDGYSACKEIKKIKDIPVLMLSARGQEYDKLFGFEMGIDDYVVKPFSPKEVLARVKVIIGRRSAAELPSILSFVGLEIDTLGREVYVDGEKINLTPKEYDLLVYLAQNKNIALSREHLLKEVWGYEYFGDNRTVDTHIKMLRGNLKEYRNYIVTVRSVGYKFEY